MNKDTFIKLIKSQGSISQEELASLDDVLKNFPACNAANILMAKGTFDKGSMFSTQKVKRAALFAPSREVLKRLIHNQNAYSEPITVEAKTAKVEKPNTAPELPVVEAVKQPMVEISEKGEATALSGSDDLVDDIYKNLSSLKSIKETVSEIETENLVADQPSETSVPALAEKKTPNESVAQPLKYYVHVSEFDRSVRKAGVDLISEYLAYRSTKETEIALANIEAPDLETQINIIQKFIEEAPQIAKPSLITAPVSNVDLSQKSTREDFDMVTETLANILIKQEKYKKAIDVFEKLKLKYPEKSAYFAEKIESTKSLIK